MLAQLDPIKFIIKLAQMLCDLRAFSAAGLFVTKLRTRLDEKTINALCFLRGHFLSKRPKEGKK